MQEITCTGCGLSKPQAGFYMDKRLGKPRTRCIECCKATPRGEVTKKTPAQRAEYRRRIGATTAEYVVKAERSRIAAERRAAGFDAHVRAWKSMRRTMPRHDAHVERWRTTQNTEAWASRYRADSAFAIKERLRTQMRKKAKLFPKLDDLMRDALNRSGRSNVVERVCGYTIAQLHAHIEALFTDGMTWQAFARGDIHIDHVKPQKDFDLNDLNDVRACWALPNLQPLWSVDNMAKGARTDWVRRRHGMDSDGSLPEYLCIEGIARRDVPAPTSFKIWLTHDGLLAH